MSNFNLRISKKEGFIQTVVDNEFQPDTHVGLVFENVCSDFISELFHDSRKKKFGQLTPHFEGFISKEPLAMFMNNEMTSLKLYYQKKLCEYPEFSKHWGKLITDSGMSETGYRVSYRCMKCHDATLYATSKKNHKGQYMWVLYMTDLNPGHLENMVKLIKDMFENHYPKNEDASGYSKYFQLDRIFYSERS